MSDDVRLFPPPEDLAPFIECYWTWKFTPEKLEIEAILPDAAPELIVHFGQPPERLQASGEWVKQPEAFLICSAFRSVQIATDQPIDMFAVRFRPWGVGVFREASIDNLMDVEALPGEVFGAAGTALAETIVAVSDAEMKIEAANAAFRAMLQQSTRTEHAIILSRLISGGTIRSGDLAEALGVSERSFRRLWRAMTGIEHRNFATLMRFHRAIALLDEGGSLADIAADCGFSDQAHMARDVKRIAGLPPGQLKKRLGDEVYGALYRDRPDRPWRTVED